MIINIGGNYFDRSSQLQQCGTNAIRPHTETEKSEQRYDEGT